MLNIAYIGFGTSVVRYHLPFLAKRTEQWNVKYIYQPKDEYDLSSDRHALYQGIEFVYDLNQIYNDNTVDLVVICSPNNSHYQYALDFLKSGKNVLVEKPFALSQIHIDEMLSTAKACDKVIMVNHNRRFDTDFLALKDAIESGKLGRILEVESHYDYFREVPLNKNGGLEVLVGLGIHTVDQMVSLFGTPKHQVNDVRSLYFEENSDDYFDLDLFYDNLKVTVKTSMKVLIPYPRFVVHGTNGSFVKYAQAHNSDSKTAEPFEFEDEIENQDNWGQLDYMENGHKVSERIPSQVTDYGRIYDSLYETLVHGTEKLISDEQLLTDMAIIFNALESVGK